MKQGRAWAMWQKLVSEQGQSGQSVSAFCRERGLPISRFFFWKKRLREAATSQFVEVQVAKTNREPAPGAALETSIEVRLGNGRSLVVGPHFDPSHLRALLAVVESVS